jgi:hypothetical protein
MLLAIALPACTLASVDAEVPSVCLTYSKSEPASPADTNVLIKNFTLDQLSAFHELLDDDVEVSFDHATVRSTTSNALTGIESATVNISTGSLPPVSVYSCDGDCLSGGAVEMSGDAAADAVAYLGGSALEVQIGASGTLPTAAWMVEVDICMSGHAHYDYKP